ncbi:hypothetical protein [Mannheimia cairinae]|uniref:hypothetical protein n=1 Tax=Mannheimia cairinae TaxID=3025936 RepID=UPI00235E0967|nr:hypothetical protein [Mannheimia cairinae]MDD0825113.1 hypothetical protein [Mannheimia cairinae]
MTTLTWHGKEDAVRKARKTPYYLLREVPEFSHNLGDSSTARQLDSSTARQLDSSTARQLDSSTARQLDSSTARQLDSSTARQLDSSTARQLDSSAKIMPMSMKILSFKVII